ncbi:DUF3040 domain-containing protein [Amycolatopsis rhabdoformis]|uniref:DUF3040 domain-containing protein n=1 Tax=Amycolatopsis rhabdoformis TaxID=1448059 RepID=A0ABZ1IGS1_9PSEU|nr:DUF3040 domain-containing protein [Amycolatopsis rhabdoformis]WSE33457.1 DUF3040 domain-containing protein [Amycolatopsis rhabdoformis]
MLSHHERSELDKIERWFEFSDPELAAALSRGKPAPSRRLLTVLAVLFDVAAVGFLVAGVVTTSPALTLCALLSAGGGVALHIVRGHGHS